MAITPIFSEDFKDNNFAARGWKSSWGGSGIFNPPSRGFDSTVGKNWVAVAYDAGKDTPRGMGDLDYKAFTTPQDEITTVIFANVISWDFSKNNHMLGVFSNKDPFPNIVPPKTRLEVTFFEPGKQGRRTITPGYINTGVTGGGFFDQLPDGVTSHVMTLNTWYEVRTRAKLNTISGATVNADGILTCQIRKVGDTAWTTTFNRTNVKYLLSASGDKFNFPAFRFHRHPPGATAGDEVRIADWRIYQGNQLGIEFDGTTPVPVPPKITGVSETGVGQTNATIAWTTDILADTQVKYGTSVAYQNTTPLVPALVTAHSVGLSGLTPGTLYFYQAISKGADGASAAAADTFTTAAVPVVPSLKKADFDVMESDINTALTALNAQVDQIKPQTAAVQSAVATAKSKIS